MGTAGVRAQTWTLASHPGPGGKESLSSYVLGGVLSHASAGSSLWHAGEEGSFGCHLSQQGSQTSGRESARAQVAELWLSYSIIDDPVAFVKKCGQPSGWKGWTPLADLSRGTDTDKQGPSPGKFVEDG